MARRRYPTLTLYVSDEEQADISRAAERLNMSKSQFVRVACHKYIQDLFNERSLDAGPVIPEDFEEWRALVVARFQSLAEQVAHESRYVEPPKVI